MSDDAYERGMRIRREVLGGTHVDRAAARSDPFDAPFQELITRYCWGDVWGRETLSRRERSLINLAMLTALNRPDEFKLHVRGAINNGLTVEDIREVLLQSAIYCGVPAANAAFHQARDVLRELGLEPAETEQS